jgi:hypothetical protein
MIGHPTAPWQKYTPHDRTAVQSAAIYSGGGGGVQAFARPTTGGPWRWARIVPISGGDLLIEIAGNDATPETIAIGSPRLLGSATEHLIRLPENPKLFIAGLTGTATFQLTWLA